MMEPENSPIYSIYTDGGCLPNKLGAWAFIVLDNDRLLTEKSGTARGTTSVRMELEATIQALKTLPAHSHSMIWTDSRVVLEIVLDKIPQWKPRGWKRSRGQQVIDLDLILQLDELILSQKIQWRWVRAHSGNKYNDHCDSLCRLALQSTWHTP